MSLISPWRAAFPGILALEAEGQTYLDSAATAQKPQALLDALLGYYASGAANVHRAQHLPGERATRAFEDSRTRVAHWLNAANPAQILFTRGATEAINLLAYGLEHLFQPGDEIVISALEHHANLLPWQQLALRRQLSRDFGELQQALIDTRRPFRDWPRLLAARDLLQRVQDLCEDQQSAVQEWLDALADWPAGEGPPEQESLRVRGRDLLEHIERVLSHARRLSASTEAAVQMHYAALGHRTNSIMRVLTVLTAIFLPLNLVTGFFGMNFDALPLIHSATGFWIAAGLMLTLGIGLSLYFWRKNYLGSRHG